MQGKIIKGIAGFYYVKMPESGIYECKAKGIFRKKNMKPLVGDNVRIEILDEEKKLGNVTEILPRKNILFRPAVSNIDQALVIFAAASPKPNLNLLDRFLTVLNQKAIPVIICFNKADLVSEEQLKMLVQVYEHSGCQVVEVSAQNNSGVEELKRLLKGRTTTVAGPSGVGKSTLTNLFAPKAGMEIGKISEKIDRGKHTTRHSELIEISSNTFIMDTPGFSSLFLQDMKMDELKEYYPEFEEYADECRFQGCIHYREPDCAVKKAVEDKKIAQIRYDNYILLLEELKNHRRHI